MDFKDIILFIPVVIIIIGFVYINFIFPKKVEKENRQKEENKK